MSVIGITGFLGVGKTFLANYIAKEKNAEIIEIDNLRRFFLWESDDANAIDLRIELACNFDLSFIGRNFILNREETTNLIFKNKDNFKTANKIIARYLKEHVKKIIKKDSNYILVWAYLVEDDYTALIDNLILVNVSEKIKIDRLKNNNNNLNIDIFRRC